MGKSVAAFEVPLMRGYEANFGLGLFAAENGLVEEV
jgi:hypothetical protein